MSIKTDEFYGDFPTLKEIKNDYYELMKIIEGINTIEQLKELDKKNILTFEINSMSLEEFLEPDSKGNIPTDNDIEYIRYDSFGCLDFIYIYPNNKIYPNDKCKPMFDVWCNYTDDSFISDITIDDLTNALYKCSKEIALGKFLLDEFKTCEKMINEMQKLMKKYESFYNYTKYADEHSKIADNINNITELACHLKLLNLLNNSEVKDRKRF